MDSEHDVTIWLITTSFRSTGGYSIVIRLDVSLPRPSIICVLEGPIRLDIRVQRGNMGNGSLSCTGREVVMLFHKINSQCREWPVWMKIDELREWSEWKVKRPMSPVHIGRVGFIHFPLLAGFMFACNGPGEWMGHHSLFPASHQTKKKSHSLFLCLKSRKNVSIFCWPTRKFSHRLRQFPTCPFILWRRFFVILSLRDPADFVRCQCHLVRQLVTYRVTSFKFKKAKNFLKNC